MDVHEQYVLTNELNGYTITAISMRTFQITVKLEIPSGGVYLICKNANILSVSMGYISILRLSSEDRCVVCVHTVIMDNDIFLFLMLSCGAYLTICAEDVHLKYPSSTDS